VPLRSFSWRGAI